jgi:hypothetical protein
MSSDLIYGVDTDRSIIPILGVHLQTVLALARADICCLLRFKTINGATGLLQGHLYYQMLSIRY